jgi:hypothetical protein
MGICFGDLLQAAGHFFKMSFFIKNIKSKGFLCSFEKKELFLCAEPFKADCRRV